MFFISKQNSPLSVLIAMIVGFIPVFIFLYIMNYKPNLSIIEINREIFGPQIGLIINILLLAFAFSLGVVIFYNLCNFINSQYLYRTPIFMVGITFTIAIWYMLSKGLPVFARVVVIIVYVDFLLYFLSFIGLIGQMDLENLRPFLDEGMNPVINGSLQYIAYNILPLFFLTIIPKNKLKQHERFNQHIIYSYLFTNISLLIITFFTVSILGIELCQVYQYAEFHILKRVSILGFITRVENTLSIQWIFDMLISCTFIVYFICDSIKRLWYIDRKQDHLKILTFVVVAILIISAIIFPTNTIAYQILSKVYPYLLYIFLFAIPLVIMLRIYSKEKKEYKKKSA